VFALRAAISSVTASKCAGFFRRSMEHAAGISQSAGRDH
jgi:hypothetical protein